MVKRSDGAWIEDALRPGGAGDGREPDADLRDPRQEAPGWRSCRRAAAEKLGDLEKTKGFARSSKVGIAVSMINPARPMGEVLPLPATLTWMRLALTPTDDGGGELRLELGDASPEDAERDAKVVEESYNKARRIEIPIIGSVDALDAATFTTSGKVIRADVKVKEMQLRQILAFVNARFGAPPPGASASPAASPATPPTTPAAPPSSEH